jgi:spore coat polysaccharide biosynthesis protein SpsF
MPVDVVIQARMASSRLPGKAVLPLDGEPVLKHGIRRATAAPIVNEVMIATTFHERDDLIAQYARAMGARVYRGSEDDVLGRLARASAETDQDVVVRLTGDNPLVPPALIQTVGEAVVQGGPDYASNKLDRTFPLGADAEAMTVETLATAANRAHSSYYREHATQYIRDHPDEFQLTNITVADVYGQSIPRFDPGIRLTLDEVADYELFSTLYDEFGGNGLINLHEAVEYLVNNDLDAINQNVTQETL